MERSSSSQLVGQLDMFVLEILADFEGFKEECRHDKQHYRLSQAQRCYKCLLLRIMRQPPTVNTCFDLIYLKSALDLDAKLHSLLHGCHYSDSPDSFNLAEVMWDTLTCCPEQDTEICAAIVNVSADVLTRLMKFLPSSDCFEFTRTMLIGLPSVPKPCREAVVAAVNESVRGNPDLAHHLRDETWLIMESSPDSLQILMLTTQILKLTRDFPCTQVGRYVASCVSILLNASKDDLRWQCEAASGLKLVSEKHPEALEQVPNQVLHSLFERLGCFETTVVRELCSLFTSSSLSTEVLRIKCLDKIFADCLLVSQDNLVIEYVLESLMASEKRFVESLCSNINVILHPLLSLLDTRSANRVVARKILNLMSVLFSQPRACTINEFIVARVMHHCARTYDDNTDTQLATALCFVSFLNGGHLPKKTDFTVANSAMSNCFSGNIELPLPELLRATHTFVRTVSSASSQTSQRKQSSFFLAFLRDIAPRMIHKIGDGCQNNSDIVSRFLQIVLVVIEHLKLHQETELRTIIKPCVRRLWPLLKFRKQDSAVQRLLSLYVYVVGAHRTKEDLEVIETGFRHVQEDDFNPESLYAKLFLLHLDPGDQLYVRALGDNLDSLSSACRVWSPELRENLFRNILRSPCSDMDVGDQIKLQKMFLRFCQNPCDTADLTKLPHLIDSLLDSRELRLHARKILLKACADNNLEMIRYVLSTHPQWREFVVNSILINCDANECNRMFRRLLATHEGVPSAVLGSLISILRTNLDNGSPNLSRALEVMLMALEKTAKLEFSGDLEHDLQSLLYRLCSRVEDSQDMSSTLPVLLAFLGSESESNRHELLEVIANGTSFVPKALHMNLSVTLDVLLYLAQISSVEPIVLPFLQLKSLIQNSEVPSKTRRSAILVLSQAVDLKSTSVALDQEFSTDELLTITDDLLLNPLYEIEALELWCAIRKDSSDAALATIIKERIRMALVSDAVFSYRVTVELLKHFRGTAKSSHPVRTLFPYLQEWSKTFSGHR